MVNYMICLDYSGSATKAFNTALQMDQVILYCNIELYKKNLLTSLKVDFDYQILDEANQNIEENTKDMLQQFVSKLGEATKNMKIVVKVEREKNTKERICQIVESEKIHTLVMGSRGVSGVERMVIGSVSDYCLRNAKAERIVIVH